MAANGASACLRKSHLNTRSIALKKGPWTVSEDSILVEYVKKHGEGNWNAVQRNSGLMRCGKSCRLRWANHLRPNLKKGAFSAEEERLIVELHAKLGNKWARMAAQLPGRTDNEIKNYWNTRFKRRKRAGLPIYPQEAACYHEYQYLDASSPSRSISSLLPSPNSYPSNQAAPLCFLDAFKSVSSVGHIPNTPYSEHDLKLFQSNNGGGLSLSLAASNPSLRMQPFYNQGYRNSLDMPSFLQHYSLDFGSNLCSDTGILELPSIQSMAPAQAQHGDASTAISSSEDQRRFFKAEPGFRRDKSSGLLDDLLGESEALKCGENYYPKEESDLLVSDGGDELGKCEWDLSMAEEEEEGEAENLHEKSDFSLGHGSSTSQDINNGGTDKEELADGNNGLVEDEIFNLLHNFPMAVPIPHWDQANNNNNNYNNNNGCGCGSPELTNGTNPDAESQPNDQMYKPVGSSIGAADQERTSSCGDHRFSWNNMTSIY